MTNFDRAGSWLNFRITSDWFIDKSTIVKKMDFPFDTYFLSIFDILKKFQKDHKENKSTFFLLYRVIYNILILVKNS